MSALRAMATVFWTQLVTAMREDKLIDPAVQQAGPATTSVIVNAMRELECPLGPWLDAGIKPAPAVEVLARTESGWELVTYLNYDKMWVNQVGAEVRNIVEYTFLPKRT